MRLGPEVSPAYQQRKDALEVQGFFNFWYLEDVLKLQERAGTCHVWNLGYGNFINRRLIKKCPCPRVTKQPPPHF